MDRYRYIPTDLQQLDRWVCATDDSKVPMRGWEYEPASCSNPDTWTFYEQSVTAVEAGYYDHIGFVFADDDGYVGIDIDTGFDDGNISQEALDIINTCQSYTERSKSGRGFHIILKGDLPFDGMNNRNGIEIYKTKRFFILTGRKVLYKDVIENQEAIDYVVEKYFKNVKDSSPLIGVDRIYNPVWVVDSLPERVPIEPIYPDIGDGCRNISLTSLAGYMKNIGYSARQIYDVLIRVNEFHCSPPLRVREIQTIVESISRYKE